MMLVCHSRSNWTRPEKAKDIYLSPFSLCHLSPRRIRTACLEPTLPGPEFGAVAGNREMRWRLGFQDFSHRTLFCNRISAENNSNFMNFWQSFWVQASTQNTWLLQDLPNDPIRCVCRTDAIGVGFWSFHWSSRFRGANRRDDHHPVVPRGMQVWSNHEGHLVIWDASCSV